jgi:hypothetical protein
MKIGESVVRISGAVALYILTLQAVDGLSESSLTPAKLAGDLYDQLMGGLRDVGGVIAPTIVNILTLGYISSQANDHLMSRVFAKSERREVMQELERHVRGIKTKMEQSERLENPTAQDFAWFKRLTRYQQDMYLFAHPGSKLNKDMSLLSKVRN